MWRMDQTKTGIKAGDKLLEEIKEFRCLGSKITKDRTYSREIRCRIHLAKIAFDHRRFFSQQMI